MKTWIFIVVIVVLLAMVMGAFEGRSHPSQIFAPPGSYVDIGGEYIPVPNDWLPGDPIPGGGR